MRKIFLDGNAAKIRLIELTEKCIAMSWAVAWATDNDVLAAASKHRVKFNRLVIGTHGFISSPSSLGLFVDLPCYRVRAPTGPLFHPKLYVFEMASEMVVIVGSHNMTASALSRNVEASVVLNFSFDDVEYMRIQKFIETHWRRGIIIDDNWLYAYAANYRRATGLHQELERWIPIKRPKFSHSKLDPQKINWNQFVEHVQKDIVHSVEGRLRVLDEVGKLFRKQLKFSQLEVMDRKRIAGTAGKRVGDDDGIDWAWFGAMNANGTFAGTVISQPNGLSDALDAIPLAGQVEYRDYKKYIDAFSKAFVGTYSTGGIATGTRLLAMKRPDQFICIDGPNKVGVCSHFGQAVHTTNLENYWERIIEPIRQTEWWLSKRPSNVLERRIWDGRAAMLDALFYAP